MVGQRRVGWYVDVVAVTVRAVYLEPTLKGDKVGDLHHPTLRSHEYHIHNPQGYVWNPITSQFLRVRWRYARRVEYAFLYCESFLTARAK